ncbi:mucin-5AC-like [Notothenia coriiceps]|uniref:Mucin-5AC-like n=1 Tax=Notothenia coriiceps TaxID=8208 RepID=A0A6I9N745_9TELE|nr:PREDICTED: mucin-5AC-like [Notothenia coriiceps]
MRNLLVGVFLGLLAVVHSTPVHTTTQIPVIAENEVIREALTDGYLVEQSLLPTLTTESPKRNTTVQQITDNTQESAKGESMDPISTSTILPEDTQENISDLTTTPNPQLSFTSSEEPNEAEPGVTATHITVPQTTDLTIAFDIAFRSTLSSESGSGDGDGEMFTQQPTTTSSMTSGSGDGEMFTQYPTTTPSMMSGSGDGDGEMFTQYPTTTSSTTSGSGDGDGEMFTQDLTTTSSRSTSMADFIAPRMFAGSEGSGEGSGSDIENSSIVLINETPSKQEPLRNSENSQIGRLDDPASNIGHSTPGWIIIVGFIVGLAALIVLFVAIATRDKWNAPNQASETKSSSSNQQREIEMKTFLHKDNPRENGTAGEYTVIPLEELPEPSSH